MSVGVTFDNIIKLSQKKKRSVSSFDNHEVHLFVRVKFNLEKFKTFCRVV